MATITKKLNKKVKRCPFCGGTVFVHGAFKGDHSEFHCECALCGAKTKSFSTDSDIHSDDIDEDFAYISALYAWNKRWSDKDDLRMKIKEILAAEQNDTQDADKVGD